MELLNSEELKNIKGGVSDSLAGKTSGLLAKECIGSGNAIIKVCVPIAGGIKIAWCKTYEAKCTGGTFTPCSSGVTSTCTGTFTLTPMAAAVAYKNQFRYNIE
ncbi:MAG: hypothetical protein LBB53_01230 [Prevotellaceae bacterium]|jgi:hypothetical protein|nr:hypothetical protein [Prevotellaceae bacterium]